MPTTDESAVCLERVDEPCAWRRSDFRSEEDWQVRLGDEHAEEIGAALERLRRTGRDRVPPAELTRDDFAFPALSGPLADAVRELEYGRGFTVLRGFPVHRLTTDEATLLAMGIALHMGRPVSQNASGDLVAHVTDYGRGGLSDPRLRAYQTREALPFHTDSADVVGLLVLQNSADGGLSTLASSASVHNRLLEHHRELLGLYYSGFVYDRRGEEADGEVPYYRNAVFGYFGGRLSCRYYHRAYIESAAEKTGVPLSPLQRRALDLFEEAAGSDELRVDMHLRPGDLQLLNNNVVVHGRTAYEDAPGQVRDLLRLWLNTPHARELPDGFARFRFGMPAVGTPGP
ncbi:TauD/TfdA family dioxygenase [Nocardiopsis suaedae]|uniref:TauD/TfdA family dioxygenase n=1 Tax=Nocardiopsis suaedae TaxID=3018444 RepID=A0ABT4TQ86_9ACTN|nr:TauD/TfdA family dioxygenase [Nocardiopsis suaedae]MDA2806845.1 TauD/TfdA family dioxygenase [Nocardiopsis suaedae]